MPTENPKISAYVPQEVFEHFKKYQEERGISMSQAAIEIFAHYFGLNLEESSREYTGGLPGRLSQVEQSLGELKDLYTELLTKVNQIKFTSEIKKSDVENSAVNKIVEQSNSLNELESSRPLSEQSQDESKLLNEPLSELKSSSTINKENQDNGELLGESLDEIDEAKIDELQSNPPSEPEKVNDLVEEKNPHQQLDFFPHIQEKKSSLSDEPLSYTPIKITAKALISRLGGTERSLQNRRSELSQEKFAEWSSKKDPDNIKWQSVKEDRRVYYIPVGSLSSELQSKLLQLVEK